MIDTKIDLGKVILLSEKKNLNIKIWSEFETKWMLVKEIENTVFCLQSNEVNMQNQLPKDIQDTYRVINLERRIRGKLQYILDSEFEKLFQKDYDYILESKNVILRNSNGRKIGIEKNYDMLNESHWFGRNIRDDAYRIRYLSLDISDIDKGFIYVLGSKYLRYDILQDKFLCSDETSLHEIYNYEELKLILAFEQYKKGLTSPIYNEIAKINNFIKDINTVTVQLKNGTIFKTDAVLTNILQINSNGKIYVAKTYEQKIIKGTDFKNNQYLANEIKCIKFNKTQLDINGENLTMLNEKIERISKSKIDEDEETEEI